MTYDSEVLADSPLRYYKLDETSGNPVDSGSQAQNGTHTNAPTQSVTGVTYNGSNQSTTIPVTSLPSGDAAYTVEWMATPGSVSGQHDVCGWGGTAGTANTATVTGLTGTNFWNYWNNSNVTTSGVTATTTAEWHYAAVYDQANLVIYINGVQRGTAARSSHNATLTAAFLAKSLTGTAFFNGKLRRVAIYSTALSSTRVTAHFNAITSSAAAALTTTSTLTVSGTYDQAASVAFTAVSTLSAAGTREQPGAAALTAVATLSAAGTREQPGAVAFTTVATLTPIPGGSVPASAALVATATLSAAGDVTRFGAVAFVASSVLSATGDSARPGAAALSAVSTLTADGTAFAPPTTNIAGTTSVVTIQVRGGVDLTTFSDMELVIADPAQRRAPTALEVMLSGAESGEQIDFTYDARSEIIWSVNADAGGSLFLTSVPVPQYIPDDGTGITMDAGTHTLHATSASGKVSSATFTLRADVSPFPGPQAADVDPVAVPGQGTKWALQDVKPGGLGSWIMSPSPSAMTEPELTKVVEVDHTTNPMDGRYHFWVADGGAKPWQFSGYCPNETFYNQLKAYSELNRRLYIIDHRGRAWKATITRFDPVLRKRQVESDGTNQDWAADYTVSAIIYDVRENVVDSWATGVSAPPTGGGGVEEGGGGTPSPPETGGGDTGDTSGGDTGSGGTGGSGSPGGGGGSALLGQYTSGAFLYSTTKGAVDSAKTTAMRNFLNTSPEQQNSGRNWPALTGAAGNQWGMAYRESVSTDPIWTFHATGTGAIPREVAWLSTQGCHIPAGFEVSITGTSDSPMVILDRTKGVTVWASKVYKGSGNTILVGGSAGAFFHGSNGLDGRRAESDDNRNFRSRGAIPDAMLVRKDLLDHAVSTGGTLGHVLHLFWAASDSSGNPLFPMVGSEARNGWGREGQRVSIDDSVDISARPGSAYAKAIARTLQVHGAYIGDNAGSIGTAIKLEQDRPGHVVWGSSIGVDELQHTVSWNDFVAHVTPS